MSFLRNAAGVFATRLLILPLGLATSIVLARGLPVDERGIYSVAMTFAALLMLFAQLGWADASIYRLRSVRSAPSVVATSALLAVGCISLVVVAACALLEPVISRRLLDGAAPTVFYLALATVPLRILTNVFAAIARGIDRFSLQNTFRVIETVAMLIALGGVLVVADLGIVAALWAGLAVRVVMTAAFVFCVARETGLSRRFDPGGMRQSLYFGLQSYAQGLAGELHERVDIFMLAWLLQDPEQVAYYTIAVTVISQLKIAPESVGSALYPQLAGLARTQAARLAASVSRQALALVVAMVAVLLPSAWLLVPLLYGEAYRPSVTPLLVLLPAMGFHTIYRVIARYFTSQDQQRANIFTQSAAVALNMGLNYLMIPRYGIVGAAAASLVSYGFEAVTITSVLRRLSPLRMREMWLIQARDFDRYRRQLLRLEQWRRTRRDVPADDPTAREEP